MKFLALEEEIKGTTPEQFYPVLKDEARHVWELQKKGIVREIYFDENHNAVLIIEADDIHAAKIILDDFPLVKNKLINFRVITLHPYNGFERLIND